MARLARADRCRVERARRAHAGRADLPQRGQRAGFGRLRCACRRTSARGPADCDRNRRRCAQPRVGTGARRDCGVSGLDLRAVRCPVNRAVSLEYGNEGLTGAGRAGSASRPRAILAARHGKATAYNVALIHALRQSPCPSNFSSLARAASKPRSPPNSPRSPHVIWAARRSRRAHRCPAACTSRAAGQPAWPPICIRGSRAVCC
ncbi:hypothetical protein BCAR13_2110008 [Paraburkholderia caribensis]|nr:hypothetical protein BCAR13_2110008 [Paraburkholderia caribensis]